MAEFIVRFEIHGGTSESYAELHQRLSGLGLVKFIVGNDGVSFHLPTATYLYSGNYEIVAVRDWLRGAVADLNLDLDFLISETKANSWFLRRVS